MAPEAEGLAEGGPARPLRLVWRLALGLKSRDGLPTGHSSSDRASARAAHGGAQGKVSKAVGEGVMAGVVSVGAVSVGMGVLR